MDQSHYEPLTDQNFILYCAKHYCNAQCHSSEEFFEDLNKIKYLKKLITRYEITNELKTNLIVNHIIILKNVFGSYHCAKILFLRLDCQMEYIKPFLVMMNLLPEKIYNVGIHETVYTDSIPMNKAIVAELRKI